MDEGEFVFLLGHSGAGKSTLLKLILREETAYRGQGDRAGQGSLPSCAAGRSLTCAAQMGIIFQDFRLIPSMTVYENVAFAMHVTQRAPQGDPSAAWTTCWSWCIWRIRPSATRIPFPAASSSAWLWPVRWCTSPKLVIADEPTGNIDPELSLEMMELLERVSKMGITVLVVTHEHELVHRFHQRVVTLSHGRIISDVPADPVAAAEDDLSLDVAAFDADDASAAKKEAAAV